MPPLPHAPNTAKITMVFSLAGNLAVNTFHILSDSPFDETSLALAAVLFRDWWTDELQGITATNLVLSRIEATSLESDTAPSVEVVDGMPLTGEGAAHALPANVTVAIKWTTALRGRSYRGRTFHLGLQPTQIVDNALASGTVTALLAAYNALLTALVSTPWQLVVLSNFHNKVERTVGVATQIGAAVLDANLDSQRRRLNGRGA